MTNLYNLGEKLYEKYGTSVYIDEDLDNPESGKMIMYRDIPIGRIFKNRQGEGFGRYFMDFNVTIRGDIFGLDEEWVTQSVRIHYKGLGKEVGRDYYPDPPRIPL